VGLIITNCIIMGRCEGFARLNRRARIPRRAGERLGYTLVLSAIAVVRELMWSGTLLGVRILGDWWTPWVIMVMPPAGFFGLATILWIQRASGRGGNGDRRETVMDFRVFAIFFAAVFTNNLCCPGSSDVFVLACSTKIKPAAGLGAAVTFVMAAPRRCASS